MRASTRTRWRGGDVGLHVVGDRRRLVRGARVGQHAGAHRRHLHGRRAVDRGDELAAERGLPRDEPVVDALELDRVAGEARAECGRDARRDLAAPRRRPGEDRPRLRGACVRRRPLPRRPLRRCRPSRCAIAIGAPRAQRRVVGGLAAGDRQHVAGERRRRRRAARGCRAAGRVRRPPSSSGSIGTMRRDRSRSARSTRAARNAPRSCSRRTASRTCSASGASGLRCRARVTAMTLTAPTEVGRRGLTPRARARGRRRVRRRMRSAGTAARPGGSTLAGSISRSAHERIAGRRTSACSQPSSCSQRAETSVAVDREVADAARGTGGRRARRARARPGRCRRRRSCGR